MKLLSLVLAGFLLTASAGPCAAQAGRPVILVVHGRGLIGFDSAQVRRDAYHALETGFRNAASGIQLEEGDVRLVWYTDILDARSAGAQVGTCPSSQVSESIRQRESTPSVLSMLAMVAGPLFEMASTDAKGQDAIDLRALAGDLRFLSDLDTRCAAELRVADALRRAHREGRPVILISHSLGALVSWSGLVHAEAMSDTTIGTIQRWITLGSPLGSAEIRQLVFGDDRAVLARPRAVREWVNVLGTDDPFAARIGSSAAGSLADVQTEKAHSEPHQLQSYLFDKATTHAVLEGWRGRH